MNILLETDQKFCFDEYGDQIDCRNSFQDAEFKGSKSQMCKRFEVCKDGVEDRWTGLYWNNNANLPGFPLSWKEAFNFVLEINNSETSNINNWRLPTRSELFSLVSHQQLNPSLPENHPFENVFNGYYWTQTECDRLPNQAWYIHLGGGRVYRGMKHGSYMVWPVAGTEVEKNSVADRFHKYGSHI
jgi:hypothetical protein